MFWRRGKIKKVTVPARCSDCGFIFRTKTTTLEAAIIKKRSDEGKCRCKNCEKIRKGNSAIEIPESLLTESK